MQHLQGARSYKRIAGYFTSSLFEVANELLETIPEVKIVCNVDSHPDDLKVAQLREAKMMGRWNEKAIEAEALLNRDRYRRLDTFLQKHGQAVRVAPDNICGFVHGKAGVIELADGRKLGFIGSMNETRSGWQRHYEILWEDESPEGVAWIEEEFEFLWNAARPLPQVVIREVHRRGYRREVFFDEIDEEENLAPAALIESPLYREGLSLQPWQQGFITACLRHHQQHKVVRLLLADHAKTAIQDTVEQETSARCLAWFLSGSLEEHAARLGEWIAGADYPQIDRDTWDAIEELSDSPEWARTVILLEGKYYVASRSYNAADQRFAEVIRPALERYSLEDCITLIEGIQGNGQTWERGRARTDHLLLRARAMELDPAFNAAQYTEFNRHID